MTAARERAAAEQQAARARRAQAEADEKAAIARSESLAAEQRLAGAREADGLAREHHARADEIDPDREAFAQDADAAPPEDGRVTRTGPPQPAASTAAAHVRDGGEDDGRMDSTAQDRAEPVRGVQRTSG